MLNENSSQAERLATLSPDARAEFCAGLTEAQARALPHDWNCWARKNQLAPSGNWRTWLVMAGRGFGKQLALDTPLVTPQGWTTMGDVRRGDKAAQAAAKAPVSNGHWHAARGHGSIRGKDKTVISRNETRDHGCRPRIRAAMGNGGGCLPSTSASGPLALHELDHDALRAADES